MFHDILNLVRKKKKTIEVSETYCILTCRCCGGTEEILGDVTMRNLSNGWGSLSIDTNQNGSVFEWLMCPNCVDTVKIIAGLKKK